MTKQEALKMLTTAPQSNEPSKVNSVLTQSQAVVIIRAMIEAVSFDYDLGALEKKRVYQVMRNQKRPKY